MPRSGSSSSPVSLTVRRRVSPAVRREVVRQLERAMRAAGAAAQVSLVFTDDEEIHALNKTFAGEDHATDVLSFGVEGPALDGAAAVAPRTRHRRGTRPSALLGDIVISIDTAARQAKGGKRPLTDELVHLAVHGLAHLLGYDHATPVEEKVMFGFEARLRAQARGRAAVERVRRPPRAGTD